MKAPVGTPVSRCQRLEKALRALLRDKRSIALFSYAIYYHGAEPRFTEAIWKEADPIGFALWKAGKDALDG